MSTGSTALGAVKKSRSHRPSFYLLGRGEKGKIKGGRLARKKDERKVKGKSKSKMKIPTIYSKGG
jgi:hypothetical protein